MLPMQEAQVQLLVGELRSHMLHGVAKKRKKKEILPHSLLRLAHSFLHILIFLDWLPPGDFGAEDGFCHRFSYLFLPCLDYPGLCSLPALTLSTFFPPFCLRTQELGGNRFQRVT